jgi:HEAT repeat protein
MSDDEFRAAFKGSVMKRAKLRGLKRNAAVVFGNVGTTNAIDVLTRAPDDPDPLVRERTAWSMAHLGAAHLRTQALEEDAESSALQTIDDPRDEIPRIETSSLTGSCGAE